VHEQVPVDWFVGFQVGLKAKFWRAASEPRADADAAAIADLLDLRALPERAFDAVVCWGNSFGYMPQAGTVEHLESTASAPGGA
jgi:hypothetical protein